MSPWTCEGSPCTTPIARRRSPHHRFVRRWCLPVYHKIENTAVCIEVRMAHCHNYPEISCISSKYEAKASW